jgi:hypothetical protein
MAKIGAAVMRWPQDYEGRLAGQKKVAGCPLGKKRPLASQRPKSREETPKEGGGNAGRATARGIHVICRHKMQEANQRLLTYSRTLFFCPPRPLYPPLTASPILPRKSEREGSETAGG